MAASEPAEAAPDPVSEDHGTSVRSAARWMVSAFAAIGTLLVAGLQLQAVTKVEDGNYLSVALGAAVVALIATGFLIVQASRVLIAPALNWGDLCEREVKAQIAQAQASTIQAAGPSTDADDLLRELVANTQNLPAPLTYPTELRKELRIARQGLKQSPGDTALSERIQELEETADLCIRLANAWQSRTLYQQLTRNLMSAGLLIAACLAVFVWASNPPEEPPKITRPTPVRVYINGSALQLRSAGIDEACAQETLRGTAVDGDLSNPQVVTAPKNGCPAQHFTVTGEIGVAVPVPTG
ncbi:hypothetical protein [Streptomyces sp. NPDC051636]|uniref:hypothetical protein n=1 Tax=Streptomyces sp. NPDC051636 TaxID=3365663 RepID=UPI0037A05BAB